MLVTLFILCLLGLAGYLFVSGFHDAPNSVAVAVRTRALTPMSALRISAMCNFLGVLLSGLLFSQFALEWVYLPKSLVGLAAIFTALLASIGWGTVTWLLRMPSSSTHALIGGLLGAAWAAQAVGLAHFYPLTESAYTLVLLPLLAMPVAIFALAWLFVFPLGKVVQRAYPRTVNRVSRNVMSLANSLISLVHGIQLGQRASMLFLLIFLCSGFLPLSVVPSIFALLLFSLVLAAGTMLGGWRIGHTFAHKMVHLDPFRGSVAQGSTALVSLVCQFLLGVPVSSSHLSASAVLGAGVNQRFSSVRPGIALKLLLTWLATVPAAFAISATFFLVLSPLLS